jgi:hypothetical protein
VHEGRDKLVRTFQYGSGTPHGHECETHMRHCHMCLLLLCAPRAQAPILSTRTAGWPLLHASGWLELGPRPAGDAYRAQYNQLHMLVAGEAGYVHV